MRPPIPYYGGKQRLAKRIIAAFPPHTHYIEAFGGSGAVMFAKPRPPGIEVYNDIDGALVNFYRVLRSKEHATELQRLLSLTLYSREEYRAANVALETPMTPLDVEWARCYFTAVSQAFGGRLGGGWRYSVGFNAENDGNRKGNVAAPRWSGQIARLPTCHQRLQGVQIECQDVVEILATYTAPDTLVYLDPPYIGPERTAGGDGYRYEMDEDGHRRLLDAALVYPQMITISGYDNELYRDALAGWQCHIWEQQMIVTCGKPPHRNVRVPRTERLWLNPAATKVKGQTMLPGILDSERREAQQAEQRTPNPEGAGSNPAAPVEEGQ